MLWCIYIKEEWFFKLFNPTSFWGSKGSDQGSDSEGTMASPGVKKLLLGVTLCERIEMPNGALSSMRWNAVVM